MEGGSGGKTKKDAEAANQADKDAELKAVEASKGMRQLIRGKRKCNRCGELGHGESSYKCRLNGTKKPPKRKARPNTTKYGPNAKLPKKRAKKQPENESGQPLVTTPTKTRETILQESPNRLTRTYIISNIFFIHMFKYFSSFLNTFCAVYCTFSVSFLF